MGKDYSYFFADFRGLSHLLKGKQAKLKGHQIQSDTKLRNSFFVSSGCSSLRSYTVHTYMRFLPWPFQSIYCIKAAKGQIHG
jgi:hypothetical protein